MAMRSFCWSRSCSPACGAQGQRGCLVRGHQQYHSTGYCLTGPVLVSLALLFSKALAAKSKEELTGLSTHGRPQQGAWHIPAVPWHLVATLELNPTNTPAVIKAVLLVGNAGDRREVTHTATASLTLCP